MASYLTVLAKQALQITVCVAAGVLVAINVIPDSGQTVLPNVSTEEGAERNERSTPRSFVLPATPGVSLEQERQAGAIPGKFDPVASCVARLRTLSYKIYGDEEMDNIEVLEAIVQFQTASGLSPTGKLDEPTTKALECDFN